MGSHRLAGFNYRSLTRRLKKLGCRLARQGGGSHELWRRVGTDHTTVVPKHSGDIPHGTVQGIIDDLGFTVQQFLNAK